MNKTFNGARLAALAATFAVSSLAGATELPAGAVGAAIGAGDQVHCYGVHSCKGESDCKTTEHDCKGHNTCGGHGFKSMKAAECLNEGGVIADIS